MGWVTTLPLSLSRVSSHQAGDSEAKGGFRGDVEAPISTQMPPVTGSSLPNKAPPPPLFLPLQFDNSSRMLFS